MSDTTKTPRTDAMIQIVEGGIEYAPLVDLIALARQLEHENRALRRQLAMTPDDGYVPPVTAQSCYSSGRDPLPPSSSKIKGNQ